MYTSPEVQARVRAKHAKGYSKKSIQKQEGVCYQTVMKILNETQATEMVAQANRDFKGLAELSVKVLVNHLMEKNDADLAQKVLASLGILHTQDDRTAGIQAGQPQQLGIQVNSTLQLGPTSMGLLQHLERTDVEFTPSDKRRREIAGVRT
jgi:ABC-type phosphate/phosphonate transport system ATPase subunit